MLAMGLHIGQAVGQAEFDPWRTAPEHEVSMALHMLRSTPSFTISLRGYDKEEVDEYVDSLREGHDVDAEALEEAGSAIARLEDENARLSERAGDLESCLRVETPRSIFALGQRLTLILEQAEDAASETVAQANEEAERLVVDATEAADTTLRRAAQQASEAEERAASVTKEAEERAASVTKEAETRAAAVTLVAEEAARRTEEDARRKAEAILAGAEARATARSAEMEAWAERMHAHLCQERDKAAEEFARVWEQRQADLRQLADRRAELVASLDDMRDALSQTVAAARAAGVAALAGSAELSVVDDEPGGAGAAMVAALGVGTEPAANDPAYTDLAADDDYRADDITGQLMSADIMADARTDGHEPTAVPGTQALGQGTSAGVVVDDGDELDGWAASWRMTDTGA
jgi:cell division septum initiation protein DivIVA